VGSRALDPGAGADGRGIGLVEAPSAHGDECLVTHRRGADVGVHHGERALLWELAQGKLGLPRHNGAEKHAIPSSLLDACYVRGVRVFCLTYVSNIPTSSACLRLCLDLMVS